ncbi:protein ALP1-like [Senna tora]|uniref:Protein ALP1-like n=1 Tax=Senna tora TaxID=362788 RepID=A0A834W1J7_9FABA|nr:protein ALP1-like [Senna tora]
MYPSHLHSIAPSSSARSDLHPRRSPSSSSSGSTDCWYELVGGGSCCYNPIETHIYGTMDRDNSSSKSSEEDSELEELLMINMIYEYESSAHDAKVLLDALTNPEANFPWPTRGSFYLMDSGYPCNGGFLPPYRGERYHAQEYRGKIPGFKIDATIKPSRQRFIVIACCTIHNYIRKWGQRDRLFREWENTDMTEVERSNENTSMESIGYNAENLSRLFDEGAMEMAALRDHISNRMWQHYYNPT